MKIAVMLILSIFISHMIRPRKIPLSDEEYMKMEKSNDVLIALSEASEAVSRPNYWSVVPPFVRYNKSLTWFEKILYSELSALSNKWGYCFASNQYFTDNFGNSERTVQVSLAHLAELGFISLQSEITAMGTKRKIFVNALVQAQETAPQGMKESSPPKGKKEPKDGVSKGDSEVDAEGNSIIANSIYSTIDNTIVSIDSDKQKSTSQIQPLPTWLGANAHLRVMKLYELMFNYKVGVKPEMIKISSPGSVAIKHLLQRFGEAFAALCVITHFEWRGIDGSDDGIYKRISNAGFPIAWLSPNSTLYYAFIKNSLKITTQEEAVSKISDALLEITAPVK